MGERTETPRESEDRRGWASTVAVVLLLGLALAALAVLGGRTLPERIGPPVEEIAVEQVRMSPGRIDLTVRNAGPDPVRVAQVFVNDAFVDVRGGEEPIEPRRSTRLTLDYPWQEGQPYLVSMMTSTGLVVEHEIAAAVETPTGGRDLFAVMALLGAYVGIIPVVLGMLLLPALRRIGKGGIRFLLAVTVGLLLFLAVDAVFEGFELGERSGGAFGGISLLALGAILAFLALTFVDRWLNRRADRARGGMRLALMIAIGIGLHNLGEGLAIGSAYALGELALGAALVIGFAVHNTTEGLAIVSPLTATARPGVLRLLGLGLIAGAPAIVGAVLGAGVDNAELSLFLLGLGVGAIGQVVVQIAPALRGGAEPKAGTVAAMDTTAVLGVAVGVAAMYATGLLVLA
ncbi:Zinc transporter ZupT [Nocardia amikacinitolerans]|uniref:ZIP family metal transporter n=1 Tax=Nocardia amikacinitolerans TaxID=756689 RepID=UPI00082F3001|nr:metal transporter [Nocardia amikacinitolerans]MCP2317898.1 Zinc transporter ZupT [Nocardia amikacinitolerans]